MSCSTTGTTAQVASHRRISLWDQVESELEARFSAALEVLGRRQRTPLLPLGMAGAGRQEDRGPAHQRAGRALVHWQVSLQNTIKGTAPTCCSGGWTTRRWRSRSTSTVTPTTRPGQEPAGQRRRDQRARLRADGRSCSSSTGTTSPTGRHAKTHPSSRGAAACPLPGQRGGQSAPEHQQVSSGGTRRAGPARCGPTRCDTLLAFLRDPRPELWLHPAASRHRRADGAGKGRKPSGPGGVPERMPAALPRRAPSRRRPARRS